MNLIERYRLFQLNGLAALDSGSQVVETSTGIIEYAVQGDGPAVLISHGSFGGYDQGLLSVNFLKNFKARLIAPSRFGYLRTPLPQHPTLQAQARAFAALLDILFIDQVWLIGLSAGGMSALRFALQFPSRCKGLILISAVNQRPVESPPVRFLVEHVLSNEFLGWFLATYLPSLVAQSTGDDYALVAKNPLIKEVFLNLAWPPLASKRRSGILNDLSQADALLNEPFEKISVSTLIIHGTADPFVPFDSAMQLAARISNAELMAFPQGGHLSFLIHQEQTKTAILNFIDKHSGDGKSKSMP